MLIKFINMFSDLNDKDGHIGQHPVFNRGDPDTEKNIIADDEDGQLVCLLTGLLPKDNRYQII